jgi:hypothetical protein
MPQVVHSPTAHHAQLESFKIPLVKQVVLSVKLGGILMPMVEWCVPIVPRVGGVLQGRTSATWLQRLITWQVKVETK